MTTYALRAIGADFDADDEGCDYASSDEAKRAAVKAGLAIAADEIDGGKKSAIVEVQLLEDQEIVARYVVAVSVDALPPI